ncbi:MAG: EndoU domain-containing protein [Oscillospiraceae bacterium]|nr:EndoU domain-containing protein [Oscillospiraceae bacterium]
MHCIECDELLTAIESFIAKADKSLADELERAGFAESEETVKQIEELEEELAEVFEEQSEEIEKLIQDAAEKGLSFDETKKLLEDFKKTDKIRDKLFPIFLGRYTEYVPHLANIYIADMDSELIVEQISKKTTGWISQWSYELSELMHLSSYNEIEAILTKGLKNGNGIDAVARDILENGIRDEYYKAKRVAVTEILRAHSMAQEEAIQQCPASEFKEWIHTGGHKNKPRENHVKMNGQRVPKNQNFKLIGADGITYLADIPHDPALPAGETINCHCTHRGVPSAEILGLPLEERKRLQQQAIAEMGDEWEIELDAENKLRAGINEATIKCDWLKNKKTVEERKKYFRSDSRWALFESGVIQNDADLDRLFKTVDTKYGKRKVFKTLTELKEDGIITVSDKTLKHSTVGDFTNLKNPKKPPSAKNGGKMKGGGHSQANIELLESKGYKYTITKTYDNGVRIGNVEMHKDDEKSNNSGQSWFPKDWNNDDVLKAGTYIVNTVESDKVKRFGEYNGVRIGIFVDNEGYPSTIFPDADNQP